MLCLLNVLNEICVCVCRIKLYKIWILLIQWMFFSFSTPSSTSPAPHLMNAFFRFWHADLKYIICNSNQTRRQSDWASMGHILEIGLQSLSLAGRIQIMIESNNKVCIIWFILNLTYIYFDTEMYFSINCNATQKEFNWI